MTANHLQSSYDQIRRRSGLPLALLLACCYYVTVSEAVYLFSQLEGLTCGARESALFAGYWVLIFRSYSPARHSSAHMALPGEALLGHVGSRRVAAESLELLAHQSFEVDYGAKVIQVALTSAVAPWSYFER